MDDRDSEKNYVLIIGSSNMDLSVYIPRLPKPGETVTGGTFRQFLGGKGANQAVASVRSGAKTYFIGKIGKDNFGDQMLFQLTKEGIDMSHVIRDTEHPSGVAFIIIDENGENMISVAPGSNFFLTKSEIIQNKELIKSAKSLVVQMEIPLETIEEIFNIASKGNVIKILNPAPLKQIPKALLKKIDIIVPNEGELLRLNSFLEFSEIKEEGKNKIIQASNNISSLGVKYIITTLGAKGCVIYERETNKVIEIPTVKVRAIDSVGAGDCFNGVLASKLCKGESLINAVTYATVAASIKVTRRGAQEGMPYSGEIEEHFKKFKK
jgi:ribokinase